MTRLTQTERQTHLALFMQRRLALQERTADVTGAGLGDDNGGAVRMRVVDAGAEDWEVVAFHSVATHLNETLEELEVGRLKRKKQSCKTCGRIHVLVALRTVAHLVVERVVAVHLFVAAVARSARLQLTDVRQHGQLFVCVRHLIIRQAMQLATNKRRAVQACKFLDDMWASILLRARSDFR